MKTKTLAPCLALGIKGLSLSEEEKKAIKKAGLFGLVLFKRNIKSLNQLFDLLREIHSLNPLLLLMMDREGGAVDRLSHLPDFPPWPGPEELSSLCSLKELEKTYFYTAREMRDLGIAVSLSPSVDIASVENPLFKGRLLGKKDLSKKALAVFKGIHRAGLLAVAKHFPGHGGVKEDSHLLLPVDQRPFSALEEKDLLPFKALISEGLKLIMTAHVLYPSADPHSPATLSPFFLKTVLRKKMNFKGLVLSDDLDMKALSGLTSVDRAFKALSAGVDVLLKCEPLDMLSFSEALREKIEEKPKEKQISDRRALEKWQNTHSIKPLSSFKSLKKRLDDSWKWYDTLKRKA